MFAVAAPGDFNRCCIYGVILFVFLWEEFPESSATSRAWVPGEEGLCSVWSCQVGQSWGGGGVGSGQLLFPSLPAGKGRGWG